MNITICGSMAFAKEMVEVKKQLETAGHTVFVPVDADDHIRKPGFGDDFENNIQHAITRDVFGEQFRMIEKSEAVLVLNYPKNGVAGYVGVASMMEMAVAHYLKKKIYLLYPVPSIEQARWVSEVRILQPVVLGGDLHKLV